jgi:hypothetical protein
LHSIFKRLKIPERNLTSDLGQPKVEEGIGANERLFNSRLFWPLEEQKPRVQKDEDPRNLPLNRPFFHRKSEGSIRHRSIPNNSFTVHQVYQARATSPEGRFAEIQQQLLQSHREHRELLATQRDHLK